MATQAKSQKCDRNRPWCQAYKAAGRREVSKLRKLVKHLKKHPNDVSGIKALTPISSYKNKAGVDLPDLDINKASKLSSERKERRDNINKAKKIVRQRYDREDRTGKLKEVMGSM
jgi:hypothetical protein